ncbi:YafY family protein [Pelagibius sp. Alg239-R121]|uniref:helix-turn-helix transcriptional regulator n=1 Tax=Pelagibius sp. Alg239-R121 TaxID=2993448 RepID=UPI0024A67566|nr:YafY family protein [Pelagibius sp. Alg239-R121]
MRRADRLFDIIQILRSADKPVTADQIAARLEVTSRTIYRDIVTLQASRVPIEGEAGVGYILRAGFDLPPLMFTSDETEALLVGMSMLRRTSDRGLHSAADSIIAKVEAVLPSDRKAPIATRPFYVCDYGAEPSPLIDLAEIRKTIRDSKKLNIDYQDVEGRLTTRTIWPIAVAYYVEVELVCAWCELRQDFRHFRVDRIRRLAFLEESFANSGRHLVDEWMAATSGRTDRPGQEQRGRE